MKTRLGVEFSFEPRVEKDGRMWSAYCDPLGMASCGATQEEAESNLAKTVQTLVRVLRRRGILAQTLDGTGFNWKTVETNGLRIVA